MSSQESIPVTIPATLAHRKFGNLLRRVFIGKEHFVVEKDGLPVVAIISMREYEEFLQERKRREERLNQFRKSARSIGKALEDKGLTEEQVMSQLEESKQEVYEEYYGDD